MRLLSRAPREPVLLPFIRAIWLFEGRFAHAAERVLPELAGQLLINLDRDELSADAGRGLERFRGATVAGPRATPLTIGTAQQRLIMGIAFRPGAIGPFIGVPAQELADRHVDLFDVWGRAADDLRERLLAEPRPERRVDLLESAARAHVSPSARMGAREGLAMTALSGGARVSDVAVTLGMTRGRLVERFKLQVGLTPKQFARVARLRRVVAALPQAAGPERSWASLALAHGYCDQAHLSREFRALANITPTEYLPRSPDELSHIPLP